MLYAHVLRVILHPDFDPTTFDYDVALLKLERPFSSSPEVSPVCLPRQSENVLPGTLCAVIGWGKPCMYHFLLLLQGSHKILTVKQPSTNTQLQYNIVLYPRGMVSLL